MYCTSCGSKNPDDAKFCSKCGKQIATASEVGAAPAQRPFDPQLAAYDLLRRLVSGRPPFNPVEEWHPKAKKIPTGFEADVDVAVQAYQLFVFVEVARSTYGLATSEKIRTHILLLSSFDSKWESRLPVLFESFKAGIAIYEPESPRWEPIEDPQTKFHLSLAVSVMYPPSWPEDRKAELLMPIAERLDTGRVWAEEVFERDLNTPLPLADTFQWSESPGPFERQLQRQQNNPLFPAPMRTISATQVTEARIADLRDAASFLNLYRPIVGELKSLPDKWTVKQASDLHKKTIDLMPQCMAAGEYFSAELKVLSNASDAMQKTIVETTKETSLQDSYERYMALTRVQGFLRAISLALPPDDGNSDQVLRSILSEDCETISNYARLFSYTSILGERPLELVHGIINEAMSRGLESDLGKAKLAAFRSGLEADKAKPPSGVWSGVKRFLGRR